MSEFFHGAITMASATVGLFFLRYWRTTRDRLFLMFSAAFWMLAVQWLLLSVFPRQMTQAHLLRFLAFACIAVAVLEKNRRRGDKRA